MSNPSQLELSIPDQLRNIRRIRRLTQQYVADKLGTSPQTVQRLETANMTMSLEWLGKFCNALEIPPEVLFTKKSELLVTIKSELRELRKLTQQYFDKIDLLEEQADDRT